MNRTVTKNVGEINKCCYDRRNLFRMNDPKDKNVRHLRCGICHRNHYALKAEPFAIGMDLKSLGKG
jgi:hypothetical protein